MNDMSHDLRKLKSYYMQFPGVMTLYKHRPIIIQTANSWKLHVIYIYSSLFKKIIVLYTERTRTF